jgi:hypothetical protein
LKASPFIQRYHGEIPPREPSSPEEIRRWREHFEENRYYSIIGRLAAEWAAFEHSIQFEIWDIIKLDYQIGACITAQIGQSGRLMDCLIALLALK